MTTRDWVAALDALEGALAQQERLLAGEPVEPPTVPDSAPGHLGPLPGELAERARGLHARLEDLRGTLLERMSRVRAELDATAGRAQHRRRSAPAYIDERS